jgi:hypothetical protein
MSEESLTFEKMQQMIDEFTNADEMKDLYDTLIAPKGFTTAMQKQQIREDYISSLGMKIIESEFVPEDNVIMMPRYAPIPWIDEYWQPEPIKFPDIPYSDLMATRLGHMMGAFPVIEKPGSIVTITTIDTSPPVFIGDSELVKLYRLYLHQGKPLGKSKRGVVKWMKKLDATKSQIRVLRLAIKQYEESKKKRVKAKFSKS